MKNPSRLTPRRGCALTAASREKPPRTVYFFATPIALLPTIALGGGAPAAPPALGFGLAIGLLPTIADDACAPAIGATVLGLLLGLLPGTVGACGWAAAVCVA